MIDNWLSNQDVCLVIRLVSGRWTTTDGPIEQRRMELMTCLGAAVNADRWLWSLVTPSSSNGPKKNEPVVPFGLRGPSSPNLVTSLFGDEKNPSNNVHRNRRIINSNAYTIVKKDGEIDQVAGKQKATCEDFFVSIVKSWQGPSIAHFTDTSSGALNIVLLSRGNGDPEFSDREFKIVRSVLTEVAWLREISKKEFKPASKPVKPPTTDEDLPPRLEKVLDLLQDGSSRKEIAAALPLSIHTINDYIKEIYQHYSVHSQGELMSRLFGDRKK